MRGNGRGVLVPLPSGVCRKVNNIGIPQTIRGSRFSPVASFIAYTPSSEADWAWAAIAQHYYQYQVSSGRGKAVSLKLLVSATDDAVGNAIRAGKVELMHAVH